MAFVWLNKITFLLWWENEINREKYFLVNYSGPSSSSSSSSSFGNFRATEFLQKHTEIVYAPNGRIELRDVISLLFTSTHCQKMCPNKRGQRRAMKRYYYYYIVFYVARTLIPESFIRCFDAYNFSRYFSVPIFSVNAQALTQYPYTLATCLNASGPIVRLLRNSIPFFSFSMRP